MKFEKDSFQKQGEIMILLQIWSKYKVKIIFKKTVKC